MRYFTFSQRRSDVASCGSAPLSRFLPIRFAGVVVALIVSCMLIGTWTPGLAEDKVRIRFGTLPVLQALPLYVAKENGFFDQGNLSVVLIPFNTASEKDIAIAGGNLDGYFGDLATPLVIKGNGVDIKIAAVNYTTAGDRRMFGVLGKPGGPYKTVKDLAKVPVAVSSNSVIHLVTEKLLTSGGLASTNVATLEAKNIGLRFQMLVSGQVEAATLPEPLVTAALSKGAVLLADDAGLSESQTVLIFTGSFLKTHPGAAKAFLNAVDKANDLINTEPDAVRGVMVNNIRLPEPLKDKYPVPRFPKLKPPERRAVEDVALWLQGRGVIKSAISFEEIVDEQLAR
ncbi:MAG: ABC transporter substrate-binding protein [Pseudomonadota bacterium]